MSATLTKDRELPFSGQNIELFKDQNSVTHAKGEGEKAFAYTLGFAHGKERSLQVNMFQAIIRSKLSEWLKKDEETFETDCFILKMGFYYQARKEVSHLSDEEKEYLEAYCDGLNKARKQYFPWELKLLGFPYEDWLPEDTFALMKVVGYLGLSQTQQDFEKFICMSLAKGVSSQYFDSLFPNIETKDLAQIQLALEKVQFDLTPIPVNNYTSNLPSIKNSNNWVIAPQKSETGKALMASDPHLEVNRLPALWFEFVWSQLRDFCSGITMPGLPGIIMGRNQNLAFSFTYGYMDTVDYFVEEIKDSKVREGQGWVGLNSRDQVLRPKKSEPISLKIFETNRGILEVPDHCVGPDGKIKDGLYLCRAWSGHKGGSLKTVGAIRSLNKASSAFEACEIVKDIFFSCNWLFADSEGNITYQQSGYLPNRKSAGIYPLAGWELENSWKSFANKEALITVKNPDTGFLSTANNNIPKELLGKEALNNINLPLASYRFDRITEALEGKDTLSLEECKTLQNDVKSLQAQKFLEYIKDSIPDTPSGRLLTEWSFEYNVDSEAAFLFERFLEECYSQLIGPVWGQKTFEELYNNSTLILDYSWLWDRILLEPNENDLIWYRSLNINLEGETVKELALNFLNTCLTETLKKYPTAKCRPWGEVNSFTFSHILLGKVAPRWLPFNQGPYPLKGNKATVHQGSLFKDRGRQSSFAPSWRMVTDLGQKAYYSVIPGGPSDRPFSKAYKSEITKWLQGQYKTVLPL